MNRSPQTQQLQILLSNIFSHEESGAVLLPDGRALDIHSLNIADIGTLPFAAQIVGQYLQIQPGQIVLFNDPYSGGTLLTTLTLFVGVGLSERSAKSDLIVALRFPLRPQVPLANTIDEEGLRIPPTPIADSIRVHEEILKAISEHPLAPMEFHKKVIEKIARVRQLSDQVKRSFELYNIQLSKSLIQTFFLDSKNIISEAFSDFPNNHKAFYADLSDGSKIKLNLDFDGEVFHIDFQGTTKSKLLALTEAATFGACFGALLSIADQALPCNSGAFQILNVRTPADCLLSAKYPQPIFFGITQGVPLTAALTQKALMDLWKRKKHSISQPYQTYLEVQFDSGQHFFDSLDGGTGASQDFQGQDGVSFWTRSTLQLSIEDLEERFPLQIQMIRARSGSGGKGITNGGLGLIKSYQMLEPGVVRWSLGYPFQISGIDHINLPQASDIEFVVNGETRELSDKSKGEIHLKAGDLIRLMSSGGYGYGHP